MNHALAQALSSAPNERWLALDNNETEIVGIGLTIEEAVEQAKQKGSEDPILLWSPKTWGSVIA